MKKVAALLLAILLLTAMTVLPTSAAGLDIPTIEYEGKTYYDLNGKDDYFKAARYGLDNRLTAVPVFIDYSRFPDYQSNNIWYCNVTNFDYTQDKLYFSYAEYSPSTVCMTGYHHDFENNTVYGDIEISYIDSAEELQQGDAMLDAELKKAASLSKKEKMRYVADYICRTVDAGFQQMPGGGYDTINGVYDLMTGVRTNVVCSSFAFLFQRFMERAGYQSFIATNENHAWNVVELDGKWYGVDCTYGDNGQKMEDAYFLMGMDHLQGYVMPGGENVFAEMSKKGYVFADTAHGATTTTITTTTMATTTTTAAATTTTTTTVKPAATTATTTTVKTTVKTTVSSATTSQKTTAEKTTATTEAVTTTAGDETTVTTTVTDATTTASSTMESTVSTTVATEQAVVKVDISEKAEVEAQVFTAAAEKGETLVLVADAYQWSFAADKLTDTQAVLNTAINLGEAVAEQDVAVLEELNQDEAFFPFSFEHHGALPGEAEISIQVDAAFAEKKVDIYSVNADGKAVLEGKGTVSADGELTFTTNHCSLWFIKEATQGADVWLYVIIGAAAVLIAGAVTAVIVWKKKKG